MPFTDPGAIASERLSLRLVEERDLPALLVVNGDDEVTRFLPYATWRSLADAQAWYDRMSRLQASGLALQFVIVEQASSRPVGTCLLFRLDEGSARAELGYVLGRARWGRGYMREALAALIDCAFGRMGLRRLEAEVNPRNTASGRVLLALGFAKEGLLRERWLTGSEARDVEVHGLLRKEWRADSEATAARSQPSPAPRRPLAAAAVVYARDIAGIADFYAQVTGAVVVHVEGDHVVLESSAFQLVVVAIPAAIAGAIETANPPTRREDTAVKLVFIVRSLEAARASATKLGGALNAPDREWRFQGDPVCDGHDPEGNVFQLREPATARG